MVLLDNSRTLALPASRLSKGLELRLAQARLDSKLSKVPASQDNRLSKAPAMPDLRRSQVPLDSKLSKVLVLRLVTLVLMPKLVTQRLAPRLALELRQEKVLLAVQELELLVSSQAPQPATPTPRLQTLKRRTRRSMLVDSVGMMTYTNEHHMPQRSERIGGCAQRQLVGSEGMYIVMDSTLARRN